MYRIIIFSRIIIVGLFCLYSLPIQAQTFFIATFGDDNAPGNPAFAADKNIYVSPDGGGNGSAKSPTTLQNAIAMLPDWLKYPKTLFHNLIVRMMEHPPTIYQKLQLT